MQRASRLKRELQMLSTEPPPGITCWQSEERIDELRARKYRVTGSKGPFTQLRHVCHHHTDSWQAVLSWQHQAPFITGRSVDKVYLTFEVLKHKDLIATNVSVFCSCVMYSLNL